MKPIIVLSLMFLSLTFSYAQVDEPESDTSRYVIVELQNGKELQGTVLEQNLDGVKLLTDKGEERIIPWSSISSVKDVNPEDLIEGELFYHNLQATRYFFGPNGFALRQGEGYYQNTWIFVNQVSYGVSDNITVGFGIVPLFLLAGTPSPVWITPKVSFPVKEDVLNVGVGGLFGTVLGETGANFGIGYGTATLGNRNQNLNISMGYGLSDGKWNDTPTWSVSGMLRISGNMYLISENYVMPQWEATLLSMGGRSLLDKVSIDYAFVVPVVGSEGIIAMPWLGVTIPFVPSK